MKLADLVTAHDPLDGCAACVLKAQLSREDAAQKESRQREWAKHRAFLRQLKQWAKTQPPEVRDALLTQISKGERA